MQRSSSQQFSRAIIAPLLSHQHAGLSHLLLRRCLSTPTTTTTGPKLKPDQPDPSWTHYGDVLNNFMDKLLHKERLGYKWWVKVEEDKVKEAEDEYFSWYDEKFNEGKTVVRMASFAPDKLTRQVTIDWKAWTMTISQQDRSGAALTESRTINIPPDWLLAMKKVPWPSQSEAEKNAAASLPAILPQIGGHDLYSVAKQKRKLSQELEELKDQLKSIYV